jgi:hypothetical protein
MQTELSCSITHVRELHQTLAMRQTVPEVTFVPDITAGIHHNPFAFGLIVLPVPLVV